MLIACPDRVGIVAKVSKLVAEYRGWLTEASYHSEQDVGWFFMRNEIRADSLSISLREFNQVFKPLAQEYGMQWSLRDSTEKKKVAILVSHASHCLADILYRWHSGELHCSIPVVISNHENLREMVQGYGIPFVFIPIEKGTKDKAHTEMLKIVQHYNAETVVLARYMQIIPISFIAAFPSQIINIHHSFLPSFVGADPYQRAYDRGVKLVGATCHYATENLDEGPIIEQDVVRVSHSHSKDDMIRFGKDVEKQVLARALRYHLEDRVIVQGNKTVILS